jgi:predicted nuclease of restriction endonuclease-like (RecB) superfamily
MLDLENKELLQKIIFLIEESREKAIRSVDFHRVQLNWHIGRYIFEKEQEGQERAEYGKYLIKYLSKNLEPIYGSSYSTRNLYSFIQFFKSFPIVNAVRSQLNWTQYRLLSRLEDNDAREFYIAESIKNHWTSRQLERQINSALYERLLLSNDKENVLAVARGEKIPSEAKEIIKDPMTLEFLGLKRESAYYEKDLETAIINHLQEFLLEMGNGFSFIARQKRILLEDDEFFVDLVFYNRILQCFVIIEIKTKKITHQDVGQLQMYVNYFDREEKLDNENPSIGILLCADKNDTMVKYSLPENEKNIFASKYKLYLPTEEQLLNVISEDLVQYRSLSEIEDDG